MLKRAPKAQIGFNYDSNCKATPTPVSSKKGGKNDSDLSDSEEDLDVALDVKNLTAEHKQIMNTSATNYGMEYGDYIRMIMLEEEEKEEIKQNKLLEAEKAQFSVI